MQYVPFGSLGFEVSRLGFGAMRLPTHMENGKRVIDRARAIALIRQGIDGGINYVDTAYGYHDGESEIVVGQALKEGYRERVKLTTKLPHWAVKEKEDLDKVLDEQLKKLDVPYVDFYILHAMNRDAFDKLSALDFRGFYDRALKDGRIKHTGFSFHDDYETFIRIMDSYPFDMAQVQFNYLDENNQAGLQGVIEAGKRHLPIVVMEPLRGGALANPPEEIRAIIRENPRKWSPVKWALRYVADRPEVVTILSGMSAKRQLTDNLRIAKDAAPGSLTDEDRAFTASLREEYKRRMPIGCTHCDYCQPCPKGVVIPNLFAAYNEAMMLGDMGHLTFRYAGAVKDQKDASQCVACRKCETICPQHLPIVEWLKTVDTAYLKAKKG